MFISLRFYSINICWMLSSPADPDLILPVSQLLLFIIALALNYRSTCLFLQKRYISHTICSSNGLIPHFISPHFFPTCFAAIGCINSFLSWFSFFFQQPYAPPPHPMAPPSPSTNSCSQGGAEQLSKTNLYIRGLPPGTTDQDLIKLCQPWVLSTIYSWIYRF